MTIKVYSKSNCVQCIATYKELDKIGIEYETLYVDQQEEAMDYVRSLGYKQAPVVVCGDVHWSGFRPDMINKYINI